MITKITIGVCIKNCEKSIKYTLKSIYEQDYEHNAIELIIVDNKSTDKTIDIVKNFLSRIRNNEIKYKIFFNKYSGLSKSRQIVIDNATGYYVIYVDGDVSIKKNFIRKHVEFMDKNPSIDAARPKPVITGKTVVTTKSTKIKTPTNLSIFLFPP